MLNNELWFGPTTSPVQGIFGFGYTTSNSNLSNLVSTAGVIASDTAGVGTARNALAACGYGEDKGIMAFGSGVTNLSNLAIKI